VLSSRVGGDVVYGPTETLPRKVMKNLQDDCDRKHCRVRQELVVYHLLLPEGSMRSFTTATTQPILLMSCFSSQTVTTDVTI
jgi:hypothetical protein